MKTTFSYDHYDTYQQLSDKLQHFSKQYPGLMELESICESKEGKQVWAVTLTNKETGNALEKPAYYIDGNHHAGEVTGSMAALHMIDYLLTNYESDGKVKQLLDEKTFYVIPKISPDGSDVYLTSSENLRSVNRNYPYEEQQDGFYAKDINNDGKTLMMRIKSDYGTWKVSELDPRIMCKRQPDDLDGDFYHVLPEGLVKNYNGFDKGMAVEKWGLDFNRNYPFGWFVEARQSGAGKYPLSNPENKAVADFVIEHKNIGFVATMHTTGGVLVYPPGTKPSKEASAADMKMYQTIGKMATKEMGYPVVNIFDAFLSDTLNYSSGAFDDWCYHTQGIPAYTVELWNLKERAGCGSQYPVKAKTEEQMEEELAAIYKWIDQECPQGIMPWTPFEHPQFGEVEIGGLDFKFTFQNCPTQYLKQEVEKTTAFCLRNAFALPSLTVDEYRVESLGEDVYKLDLIIGNKGYLPTYLCEEAKHIQVAQDIEMSFKESVDVLNKSMETLGHLEGFGTLQTHYGYEGIETDLKNSNQKRATYIVKTKHDFVTLCVKQNKSGKVEKIIKLKD